MSLVLDHDINVFVFLYYIGLHDLGTRFHIVGWQIVDTRDSITVRKPNKVQNLILWLNTHFATFPCVDETLALKYSLLQF